MKLAMLLCGFSAAFSPRFDAPDAGKAGGLDAQILASLGSIDKRLSKVDKMEDEFKLVKETAEQATAALTVVQQKLIDIQKLKIAATGGVMRRSHDGLSDECARYLGACYLVASLKQDTEGRIKSSVRDLYEREIKNIMGVEAKTAISTSDIPMPTEYRGDIVELVYKYGQARQYGTVFPLGAGTVKLPKLGTDPAFTLNAISAAVSEKVPTASNVTFTPEKFGGLLRLPTEIDEDSIIAMGQFIARYIARQLALCEDWQFFRSTGAGSGVNGTAEGLTKNVVTDGIKIDQASTKTKQSDATLQNFRDLRSSSGLSGAVLGMSAYYVHPTYEALFCTFNTSSTVTPYITNGPNGPTLDGFPIRWVSVMPAYSTSASASLCHALFGDATFHYLGVRGGPRIDTSKDAGFTTDEVLTRALQRMTTGKMATAAVAGLVTAAS